MSVWLGRPTARTAQKLAIPQANGSGGKGGSFCSLAFENGKDAPKILTIGSNTIKVTQFQRRSRPNYVSIERLFAYIRAAMPSDVECTVKISPNFSAGVLPRLGNIIEAARCRGDVNHVTGDEHFLAFGLPSRNTVLTIHDCGPLHRTRGLRRALLLWLWYKWPTARCAVVTAISEATKKELEELVGVGAKNVKVIYNCVGPEFVAQVRGFNNLKPRVLVLGTTPNKNLERVAAALRGVSCEVEVVGTLSDGQQEEFVRNGLRPQVLGRIDDTAVVAAYGRCDLVLFPSMYEGFGMPIIEAQATGRAVVTSNCSSMPEVAGGGACLVDPYCVDSIRDGVLKVFRDQEYREGLIAQGLANVKRFRPAVIAAQYAAIYREICLGTAG